MYVKKQAMLERVTKRAELLKYVFEMGGIAFAMWWGYRTFFMEKGPALENTIQTVTTINIDDYNETQCLVTCGLEIKNLGKSSLVVDSVRTNYIQVDIDSVMNGVLFDVQGYIPKYTQRVPNKTTTKEYNYNHYEDCLIRRYSPDANNKMTIVLLLEKCKDCCFLSAYKIWFHNGTNNERDSVIRYDWKIRVMPDK